MECRAFRRPVKPIVRPRCRLKHHGRSPGQQGRAVPRQRVVRQRLIPPRQVLCLPIAPRLSLKRFLCLQRGHAPTSHFQLFANLPRCLVPLPRCQVALHSGCRLALPQQVSGRRPQVNRRLDGQTPILVRAVVHDKGQACRVQRLVGHIRPQLTHPQQPRLSGHAPRAFRTTTFRAFGVVPHEPEPRHPLDAVMDG